MIKACVIGWPIAHSRSPLIHNYWLKQLGINGHYDRVPVEPQNLEVFIKNLKDNGYKGCNITIPHKEAAIALLDHCDHNVKTIGAVNTIYLRNDQLYGESTDGDGFLKNLIATVKDFEPNEKTICVLGAGGSAKAIIERLCRAGVKAINVVNRTLSRAEELQRSFTPIVRAFSNDQINQALEGVDVFINTTSQGMVGQPTLNIDLSTLSKSAIVCDIVYVPLKTDLINRAEARGNPTVPGLGMLLHQAVRGFELWFGQEPTVTSELYNLVARDIDPDFKP
jgi:shikimate dehydrogenase